MGASERAGGEGDWKRQLPLDGITRGPGKLTGTWENGSGLEWTRLGCDKTGKDRQDRQGRRKTGKEIAT